MSRSIWKGPFVDPSLIKKVEKLKNTPLFSEQMLKRGGTELKVKFINLHFGIL